MTPFHIDDLCRRAREIVFLHTIDRNNNYLRSTEQVEWSSNMRTHDRTASAGR